MINDEDISVLIIDDDPEIVSSLKALMKKKFGECYTAANGQEGLDIILLNSPSVIISDYKMPEMDGSELAEYSKLLVDTTEAQNIPVIIMTAYPEGLELAPHADMFFLKPFDFTEMANAVRKLVNNLE